MTFLAGVRNVESDGLARCEEDVESETKARRKHKNSAFLLQ